MIANTIHGLSPFECVSAMQKFIRRGMEREAMEMACEMGHTSKNYASWCTNRLQIISHEDIGLACPNIIPLVRTCCEQAKEFWETKDIGKWRMMVGTAIRAMCRAPKSREGDHFQAACALPAVLEGKVPQVPDFAFDHHTCKGRKLGRGLEYFKTESTRLVPAPSEKDPYEDEAYRLWQIEGKGGAKPPAEEPAGNGKGKGTAWTTRELF